MNVKGKLGELRSELGHEVQANQSAVDAFDEAVARYLGINRTDLRCIDLLWQHGPMAPSELGARLGLTTGSMTALLDRMESRGYLTRSPDPADRRMLIVELTEHARTKAWDAYGPMVEEGNQFVARYTAAELEVLIDYLRRGRLLYEQHVSRVRAMPSAGSARPERPR